MRKAILCALLLASFLAGCSDPAVVAPDYSVRFRDRVVDLEPFLIGFPYSGFRADLEHGHLFYFEKTPGGTWLRRIDLSEDAKPALDAGEPVTDVDWSTRTFGRARFHPPSNRLFFTSDEQNDEHLNVYAIDLETAEVERLTKCDYTYAWGLSEDHRYLAYLDRKGLEEPFDTTLRVRDLETGEEREVMKDGEGKDRFTWSHIRFTRDDAAVVLSVQHDGQRNRTTLARIDWRSPTPEFDYLLPPRVHRPGHGQVEGWIQDDVFLYTSAETGFRNLYRYDLASRTPKRLTGFEHGIRRAEIVETEPPSVLLVLGKPHESELLLVDAATGETLHRQVFPASVSILDAHGTDAFVSVNSLETPFRTQRLRIFRSESDAGWKTTEGFGVPTPLARRLSHLDASKVSYRTFDGRDLHAFYLEPRVPPDRPEDRLVTIISFYGGGNRFSTLSQILAAVGIATLSPAPRGSSGFGAAFSALNDRDLGGDEIVDILHAGKWLVEEKGFEPGQIGVRGGSHGGYATMRCLTFPPETNGCGASFDFGFGWSHAGFSDILTFYASCNIPDWVVKEAGDPKTERAKLLDRSPIRHVHRLSAPLLLTHGENDWRVPVTESRRFARRAEELGKPVTYVEFPGQGHGVRGFENQVRYYQTVLTFLEGIGRTSR